MQLRVVTYNIHKGIGGVDRRYRPERIVEVLRHYQPDVCLLQEVDQGVPRSRRDDQAELLSESLDLPHFAFQANVRLRTGRYGNAILSRFPLFDVRHIDVTVPLKKRRRALVAHCRLRVEGHQRTLIVVNVHLGLASFERQMQIRRLLESDVLAHAHHDTPTVFGGDFNDVWANLSKRMMAAGYHATASLPTFPAMLPFRPLDRVYVKGSLSCDHSYVGHIAAARQASDHRPLVAVLEVTHQPRR